MRIDGKFAYALVFLLLIYPNIAHADLIYETYGGAQSIYNALKSLQLILLGGSNKYIGLLATMAIAGILFGFILFILSGGRLSVLTSGSIKVIVGLMLTVAFLVKRPYEQVQVYDPTINQVLTVGNMPMIVTIPLKVISAIEKTMIDIIETSTPNPTIPAYTATGGGNAFKIIFSVLDDGAIDMLPHIRENVKRFTQDCILFEIARPDTTLTLDVINRSSLFDILNHAKSNFVYTEYYPSMTASAVSGTCTDAANTIISQINNSGSVYDIFNLAKKSYNGISVIQAQNVSNMIYSYLTDGSVSNARTSMLLTDLSKIINDEIMSGGLEGAIKVTTNQKISSSFMTSGLVLAEWLPIVRGWTLSIAISILPIIFLFLATPLWTRALQFIFGIFLWVALWNIIDVIMYTQGMSIAYDFFANYRQFDPNSLAALLTGKETLTKTIAMFAGMRSMGLMLSTVIAGMITRFGGVAVANMARGLTSTPANVGGDAAKLATASGYNSLAEEVTRSSMSISTFGSTTKGAWANAYAGAVGELQKTFGNAQLTKEQAAAIGLFNGAQQKAFGQQIKENYPGSITAAEVKGSNYYWQQSADAQNSLKVAMSTNEAGKLLSTIEPGILSNAIYGATTSSGEIRSKNQELGLYALAYASFDQKNPEARSVLEKLARLGGDNPNISYDNNYDLLNGAIKGLNKLKEDTPESREILAAMSMYARSFRPEDTLEAYNKQLNLGQKFGEIRGFPTTNLIESLSRELKENPETISALIAGSASISPDLSRKATERNLNAFISDAKISKVAIDKNGNISLIGIEGQITNNNKSQIRALLKNIGADDQLIDTILNQEGYFRYEGNTNGTNGNFTVVSGVSGDQKYMVSSQRAGTSINTNFGEINFASLSEQQSPGGMTKITGVTRDGRVINAVGTKDEKGLYNFATIEESKGGRGSITATKSDLMQNALVRNYIASMDEKGRKAYEKWLSVFNDNDVVTASFNYDTNGNISNLSFMQNQSMEKSRGLNFTTNVNEGQFYTQTMTKKELMSTPEFKNYMSSLDKQKRTNLTRSLNSVGDNDMLTVKYTAGKDGRISSISISRSQEIRTGSSGDASVVYHRDHIYSTSSTVDTGQRVIAGSEHQLLSDAKRELSVKIADAIKTGDLNKVKNSVYSMLKNNNRGAMLNTISEQISDTVKEYYSSSYDESESNIKTISLGIGLDGSLGYKKKGIGVALSGSLGAQTSDRYSKGTHNKLDQLEADIKNSINTLGTIVGQAQKKADDMGLKGQQRDSFIYNEFTKAFNNTRLSGILSEIKEMENKKDKYSGKEQRTINSFDIPPMP